MMPKNLLSKFSLHAKNSIETAIEASRANRSKYTGSLHLAYGILKEQGSVGRAVLNNFKISAADLKSHIQNLPKTRRWQSEFSENLWRAIEIAALAASTFNYRYLGTEHILIGILSADNSDFAEIIKNKEINVKDIKKHIKIIFESSAYFPEIAKVFDRSSADNKDARKGNPRGRSALEAFGIDLTQRAAESRLDLIVGREKEVERLINILGRKNKNNPILIGDPGVGKTAIAHRLAQKIANNNVPAGLIGKKIISLDMALLVAGTVFRGEFEARLKDVIEEVENNDDIILFIDEIHSIVGAGSASGSLDAANILKPSLARGEFQCIGATTLEEYKKYIEKDAALERRFQPILVEEPSQEDTIKMLSGIKHIYENYHSIQISEEAIRAAADLSARYIQDRKLPDKALDLIDEAAAKIKSKNSPVQEFVQELKKLENEKTSLEEQKENSIKAGNYEKAISERDRIKKLNSALQELENNRSAIEDRSPKISISRSDIEALISENTGIPAAEIRDQESRNLKNIENKLKTRIIGQDEAVSAISKAIRRSRAGLADPKRPIGSFMFLGPTGVGKTELAKSIAEEIFGNPKSLIKMDMSEFSEKHTVSRLIGAPAGYAGYGEGGRLTEQIRRNPYSVVLFDEIEKAHPDVLNVLLQIMEDGALSDSSGRQANFKNSLVIITSNIGTSEFTEEAKIGFASRDIEEKAEERLQKRYGEIKKQALEELKEQMLPEILNRLSGIIVFKPLGKKEITEITNLELEKIIARIKKEKGIAAKATKTARLFLEEKAFVPEEGARTIRGIMQKYIEDPMAEMIINGEIKSGDACRIELEKKNNIAIKKINCK